MPKKYRTPWEQAIADHAHRDTPREACGVIAEGPAGLEAYPLRNTHPSPENCFLLDPGEYVKLYATGKVRAYYHSHPTGPLEFSEADKVLSEETGLPCYLYAIEQDELGAYSPSGWCPPLEGRRFMPGVNDCLSLVRDYLRTELGILTELPPRTEGMLLHGIPEMAEWVKRNRLVPHPASTVPVRGDIMLMHIRAAGSRPNHVAVYVGDGLILQQTMGDPSGLAPWGGMWEHCTTMILRHEILQPAAAKAAGTNLQETMADKMSP